MQGPVALWVWRCLYSHLRLWAQILKVQVLLGPYYFSISSLCFRRLLGSNPSKSFILLLLSLVHQPRLPYEHRAFYSCRKKPFSVATLFGEIFRSNHNSHCFTSIHILSSIMKHIRMISQTIILLPFQRSLQSPRSLWSLRSPALIEAGGAMTTYESNLVGEWELQNFIYRNRGIHHDLFNHGDFNRIERIIWRELVTIGIEVEQLWEGKTGFASPRSPAWHQGVWPLFDQKTMTSCFQTNSSSFPKGLHDGSWIFNWKLNLDRAWGAFSRSPRDLFWDDDSSAPGHKKKRPTG